MQTVSPFYFGTFIKLHLGWKKILLDAESKHPTHPNIL